ncbi:MAG: hypothetical protein JWM84_1570 [Nocardioides sp.]|nr:hypothetical protein [Nocardioides sp.]
MSSQDGFTPDPSFVIDFTAYDDLDDPDKRWST